MLTDAIANLEYQVNDPNNRDYISADLGIWRSAYDVNIFFSKFNHSTGYKDGNTKLRVGNYVTIQDGTYNTQWMIAGFDMESNQIAADGTTFDNGYGICMIPKTNIGEATWNDDVLLTGAYKSSTMHTTHLPGIVTKLQTVLGSHIVQRNVLLSSSGPYKSSAYTWTTAYATLMSAGQMTGTFASHNNKYDDGEANYKLPIFNYKEYKTGSGFWIRGFQGSNDYNYSNAWNVSYDGSINASYVTGTIGVRPLIYLR